MRLSCIASSRRRCSMARRRASMHEGPLAELFRATEAAQKQAEQSGETEAPPPEDAAATAPAVPETEAPAEPDERTVEHVPSWEEAEVETPAAVEPEPVAVEPEPEPVAVEPEPEPELRPADLPPVTHYLEALPESPARLHRTTADAGSYL